MMGVEEHGKDVGLRYRPPSQQVSLGRIYDAPFIS